MGRVKICIYLDDECLADDEYGLGEAMDELSSINEYIDCCKRRKVRDYE